MSRFLDLTQRCHDPDDPYAPDRLLPSFVSDSPFRIWKPGDPIPRRGVFILLGIATWSGYDMQLLDTLQGAMVTNRFHPTIGIFNAGVLTSQESVHEFIPDAPLVFHTPVVGVWHDGVLTERAEGFAARDLVARMFGSSSEAVIRALNEARTARAG